MLTKNFYNWVIVNTTRKNITGGMVTYSGSVNNSAYYQGTSSAYLLDKIGTFSVFDGNSGVVFGTGTTPATIDDYKLESPIYNGFTRTGGGNGAMSVDDKGISFFAVYGITNTGTDNLVISEIGLFGNLYYTSNTATECCLLDRTVLETPITIAPNESKQLTYTIRMNYPTA